jgi:hypothetical protein
MRCLDGRIRHADSRLMCPLSIVISVVRQTVSSGVGHTNGASDGHTVRARVINVTQDNLELSSYNSQLNHIVEIIYRETCRSI